MMAVKRKTLVPQSLIGLRVQAIMGSCLPIIQKLTIVNHNHVLVLQKIYRLWKAIIGLLRSKAHSWFDFNLLSKTLNYEAVPVQNKFITILKRDNRIDDEKIISIVKPVFLQFVGNHLALQKRQTMIILNNRTQEKILSQGKIPTKASNFAQIVSKRILKQDSLGQRNFLLQAVPKQTGPDIYFANKYSERVTKINNFCIERRQGIGKMIFSISSQMRNWNKNKIIVEIGDRNRGDVAIKPKMIGFLNKLKPMLGVFSVVNILQNLEGFGCLTGSKNNDSEMAYPTWSVKSYPQSRTRSLLREMSDDNSFIMKKYSSRSASQVEDRGVIKKVGEQIYTDFERKSNALLDRRRRLSFTGG